MKFACPNCTQHLEVDNSWSGGSVECPTCRHAVFLPRVIAPASQPPAQAGGRKWWLGLVAAFALLAAVGWSVAMWPDPQARSLSVETVETEEVETVMAMAEMSMEEGSSPVDEVSMVAAEPEEVVVEVVESVVNPVDWLRERPELRPDVLLLTQGVRFPAVFQGRSVGEVTVPPGTEVELAAWDGETVRLRYRDGELELAMEGTNLAETAAVLMAASANVEVPEVPAADSPVVADVAAAEGEAESEGRLLEAAAEIDGLIKVGLAKRKTEPPAAVDDARFLRRTYLTAIGRIPTEGEAEEFLTDPNPHKRSNLVSRLVRSPGYASQMTNWVFDRLRIVDHNSQAQIRLPVYRQWVREAVETNMPWDQMVTSLLTGLGGGWDGETATVGYFTRDRGMPLDNLAITMRVFLGSRMECAQCHNDPFGDTKQKTFFRLAAFTNGQDPMHQDVFYGIYREMTELSLDSIEHRAARMFWQDVYGNSLGGGGTGRIALPHDYQYRDARPGDVEGAKTPFGKTKTTTGRRDRDDGRSMLAEWMTQGTGERFPGMIANSMWRKIMGRGFFEPSDDYVESAEAHDPAVAAYLVKMMEKLNYNLRDFQEVLMLTEAFQAGPNPGESEAVGGADDFRGRPVQRLAAEQVWDSLVTLVSGNPDHQAPQPADRRIFVWGQPVLEGQMDMGQLSREVLAIKDERELRRYFLAFVDQLKAERDAPQVDDEAVPMMQRDPVDFVRGTLPRASELPSPAPRNHFVALFGQSGRDVVDGATREPNIGQVLSLMNGFVQQELIAKQESKLNETVREAPEPADKIRKLYLAIFSREPTAEEAEALASEFERAPATAHANIASAMLMSAEFLYLQ